MHLSRDFASVWLLKLLLASKWASLKRDVRTLWVSVDEHGQRGRSGNKSVVKFSPHSFDDGWSEYHEGPNCTLDRFRNWGRNGLDPMTWLSHFLKEFDRGSKERTAVELKTLVRCLWLSGVYDQFNAPNFCCLEEITRRVCINLRELSP